MKKTLLLEDFEITTGDYGLGGIEDMLRAFIAKNKKISINLLLEVTEEKDNAENVRN